MFHIFHYQKNIDNFQLFDQVLLIIYRVNILILLENEVKHFVNIHLLYQIMINENMQVILKMKYLVNHQDVIDHFVRYKNVLNNYILRNVLHNNQKEVELQVDLQLDQD